jgi:hypothetical protein
LATRIDEDAAPSSVIYLASTHLTGLWAFNPSLAWARKTRATVRRVLCLTEPRPAEIRVVLRGNFINFPIRKRTRPKVQLRLVPIHQRLNFFYHAFTIVPRSTPLNNHLYSLAHSERAALTSHSQKVGTSSLLFATPIIESERKTCCAVLY